MTHIFINHYKFLFVDVEHKLGSSNLPGYAYLENPPIRLDSFLYLI